MKKKIVILRVAAEAAKCVVVLAGIVFLALPEAWAENGQSLALVLLSMVGCAGIMWYFWNVSERLERTAKLLRRWARAAEQARREAEAKAERRAYWDGWFHELEADYGN